MFPPKKINKIWFNLVVEASHHTGEKVQIASNTWSRFWPYQNTRSYRIGYRNYSEKWKSSLFDRSQCAPEVRGEDVENCIFRIQITLRLINFNQKITAIVVTYIRFNHVTFNPILTHYHNYSLIGANISLSNNYFPLVLIQGEAVYFLNQEKSHLNHTPIDRSAFYPWKLLVQLLTYFLKNNNVLHPRQLGFREDRSCKKDIHAILTSCE